MYKDNGYIYVVYKNLNGKYHCERFPIIYANQTYIYYKVGSQEKLDSIRRKYLYTKEDVERVIKEENYPPSYFMSLDAFAKEDMDRYEEIMKKAREDREIIVLKNKYFHAIYEVEETAERYKKLTGKDIEVEMEGKSKKEFLKSFK